MAAENAADSLAVLSPMPTGSGSIAVHRMLEQHLPGYRVAPYNPRWTLFPPGLAWFSRKKSTLIHTGVDYGVFLDRPSRPLVVTFHNYVLDRFMRQFSSRLQWLHYRSDLRLFTRLSLRHAAAVTAVSEATACLVREDLGYKGEIVVIPNGIDTSMFRPADNSEHSNFTALFSGNFTRRKGVHLLPGIAARLERDQAIVCVGAQGESRPLVRDSHIRFEKRVPYARMPGFYASCDALLMPTAREGMSLAVLEGMACGLPVVATDCPSMREVVEDGKGGFLCAAGDEVAFAERLQQLACQPALRAEMGAFNRRRILARHGSLSMVERYRLLFRSLDSAVYA
ncbi:MAG: glycosyltransferase family 1 protein [Nevskia sp.]|nr:glycosyltransferase family 1 protein [Nevskia sp.]